MHKLRKKLIAAPEDKLLFSDFSTPATGCVVVIIAYQHANAAMNL